MDLNTHLRPIALIGNPVAHSISPWMHNLAFKKTGLSFVYVAARVDNEAVEQAVRGLAALGFRGANVTIPHKRNVIPYLDELTPRAEATGAVNTIICEGDGARTHLVGDNTDVQGFLDPLAPLQEKLRGKTAVILGSGGAARAVVYALLDVLELPHVYLVTRNPKAAPEDLAGTYRLSVIGYEEAHDAIGRSSLVVNATPVGMSPDVRATPWQDADVFGSDHIVYDLIYNPKPTRLLVEAGERGATVIDGLDMLIGQAAAAFAKWTGEEMPVGAIRKELLRSLEAQPG